MIITIRAGSSPVSRTIRTKKSPASEFVRNDGLAFFPVYWEPRHRHPDSNDLQSSSNAHNNEPLAKYYMGLSAFDLSFFTTPSLLSLMTKRYIDGYAPFLTCLAAVIRPINCSFLLISSGLFLTYSNAVIIL